MPIENMEEEGLEKNPNLELAQIKFLLSRKEHKSDKQLASRLLEAITTESESQFRRNESNFLTAFC
jgi:26S proteasome regulatory subunit N7